MMGGGWWWGRCLCWLWWEALLEACERACGCGCGWESSAAGSGGGCAEKAYTGDGEWIGGGGRVPARGREWAGL